MDSRASDIRFGAFLALLGVVALAFAGLIGLLAISIGAMAATIGFRWRSRSPDALRAALVIGVLTSAAVLVAAIFILVPSKLDLPASNPQRVGQFPPTSR